jgi:hypothetical protein
MVPLGRNAGSFRAAGEHDLGGAGLEDVARQYGRLHTGAADFVNGGCAGRIRQLRAACSLARRGLSLSSGQNAAHEHLVDELGCQFGRSTGVRITWDPRLWAVNGESSPWNLPRGVLAAATTTTGSEIDMTALLLSA